MGKLKMLIWGLLFVIAVTACDSDEKGNNNQLFLLLGMGTPSSANQLAEVTTTAIAGNLTFTVNIAGTSAIGGGNVTSQGASAVTERGLCWNTTGNPAISDSIASDGSGTGEFTNASMTGLMSNTIYYVRAYATNSQGTAYGNVATFNSGRTFGTVYAGGYVFYNDGNGGGLVLALTDQGGSAWIAGGATQTTLNGKTSTGIGMGLTNTNAIVAQSGHTGSAALVCLNYDDGTYSDWYLPSKDELNLMYTKLKVIGVGGFADAYYWSSSEYGATTALLQNFYLGGYQYHFSKDDHERVRAVRAF